ncbi:MAG: adenine methyltransferase, partial [Alphaproteobacteria bacterium]|nr:adenine methyltransferase [Alphaproteobacteria bacterium]
DALGESFDLDVAHPGHPFAPWVPAGKRLLREDDGLVHPWRGFVWMNPPFGGRNALCPWLERFFTHGDGVALTPDRTSAPWWQSAAKRADAILFVSPKIKFIGRDGDVGKSPAQGTTLLAGGARAVAALDRASAAGLGVVLPREARQ